jgi:hypothetical protein
VKQRGIRFGALLCLVAACGRSPGSDPAASSVAPPAEQAAAIARAVSAGRAAPACGASALPLAGFDAIAVTSKQCLSCLEVGGLLREAQRDVRRNGGMLWVLSSQADTADVCAFVRKEKVRLPVVFVADTSFPRGEQPGDLLLMSFDSAGALKRMQRAATGMQLLAHMRGQQSVPSTAR